MVLCAVVRCSNRSEREKGKRFFFRLPAIVTHQRDKTHELSNKRRGEWLARIKRDDLRPEKLEYVRVCSGHFVSGMPAKLYDSNNPDWAPSLKLGYNKTGTQAECSLGRYERAIQRNTRKRPAPTDIGHHSWYTNTNRANITASERVTRKCNLVAKGEELSCIRSGKCTNEG